MSEVPESVAPGCIFGDGVTIGLDDCRNKFGYCTSDKILINVQMMKTV
jgi:hypothetical protein